MAFGSVRVTAADNEGQSLVSICARASGMEPLKVGSTGPLVEQWEIFLRGQKLLTSKEVDTRYTEETKEATKLFQLRYPPLDGDGVAGNQTIGYAMAHHGFELFELSSQDFPAQPPDAKTLGFTDRQKLLGEIKFTPAPTSDNPEAIRITNDWKKLHLTPVSIPQLRGVNGAPSSGVVDFNKAAAGQLQALFQDWEKEGLLRHILSWGGTFAPRFIRGSRTTLSQHAHASAFDMNVPWNPLGARGALVGEKGSVRELALTAYRHGFFWGGWYKNRKDAMHFEIFRVA
jgi:D-alanyl-D-alanine carboxypeptidase